jgi:hypothetical protein
MNGSTTVTPRIGCYVVSTAGPWGVRTYYVAKDKRCTCGGTARRPCPHIRAVTDYLREGGRRAPVMPEVRPRFGGCDDARHDPRLSHRYPNVAPRRSATGAWWQSRRNKDRSHHRSAELTTKPRWRPRQDDIRHDASRSVSTFLQTCHILSVHCENATPHPWSQSGASPEPARTLWR